MAIAARLLRLGIRETRTNAGPWIGTFTDGNAEAWCADFVSYVLRLAGRPFTGGLSGGWRLAAAAGVRDWFASRHRYRRGSSRARHRATSSTSGTATSGSSSPSTVRS